MEQRHYFLHKDNSLEFHYEYGIQVDLFGFDDMQFNWFDLHKILEDSLEYDENFELKDNYYEEFVVVEQSEVLKMPVYLENCEIEIEEHEVEHFYCYLIYIEHV